MNNGIMVQYFEWYLSNDGTLWKKVAKQAKHLASDGVTAVWLPPAYKGAGGINDVGYGVYDLYDLGEFNQKGTVRTKYGTKDEYLKAILALQQVGIAVYGDIVFNQMMGADKPEEVMAVETASNNREEEVSQPYDIEAWTRFTFPGRKGKYSTFTFDHTCFDGVDYDQRKGKNAIYNLEGQPWDQGVDRENANYDYLMGADVCFSNPKVRQYFKDWGQWYLDTTKLDGFRLDALKHIDNTYFPEWLGKLRSDNKKELFTVGEYWSADLGTLKNYLAVTNRCLSLFDVPLHFNFFAASHGNGNFDMSKLLDNTLVQCDPQKAVTFVDNHDTQAGQALQSAILDWFVPLAYAAILLRNQGYPCVFYGNYYGVPSHNGVAHKEVIDVLMKARRTLVYGIQHDYFDDFNVIGWTYEGDQEHNDSGIAVIMSDNISGQKMMYVGEKHAKETWVELTGQFNDETIIDENGQGIFKVNGGALAVYAKKTTV